MERWVRVTNEAEMSFFSKVIYPDPRDRGKDPIRKMPTEVWQKRMYDGSFTAIIVRFEDEQNYFLIRSWVKPRISSLKEKFNGKMSMTEVKKMVTEKVHKRKQYHDNLRKWQ